MEQYRRRRAREELRVKGKEGYDMSRGKVGMEGKEREDKTRWGRKNKT